MTKVEIDVPPGEHDPYGVGDLLRTRGCSDPLVADAEMVQGYRDGSDPDAPEPSANRSASYRHGFLNARADRAGCPRDVAAVLRRLADEAMAADHAKMSGVHDVMLGVPPGK